VTLTPLEQWKFDRLKAKYPDLAEATPLQILEHAIEEETTQRMLSPFDPAVQRFAQVKIDLENFALLKEKVSIPGKDNT